MRHQGTHVTLHCRIRRDLRGTLVRECARRRAAGIPTTVARLVEEALELWQVQTTLRADHAPSRRPLSVGVCPEPERQPIPPTPPSGYEDGILR